MTPEERAEKWFRDVPESKTINLEKKVEICREQPYLQRTGSGRFNPSATSFDSSALDRIYIW